MANHMISIICPTYNSVNKMKNLLESIGRQNYDNYEVIFIDDGSEDDTYTFLKKYSLTNKRIRVYRKSHEGPGPARKFGFLKSRGDLLFFIDSDDWIASFDSLMRMNDIFLREDIDICFTPRKIFPSNEISLPFVNSAIEPGLYDLEIFRTSQIYGGMGMKIFRRSMFESDMFVGTCSFEDLFTTYNYLASCNNILYTDQIFQIVNHSMSNESLTRSADYAEKSMRERLNMLVEMSRRKMPEPIKIILADTALDVYCRLLINRRKRNNDERKKVSILRKMIKTADLSGFLSGYSSKKKIVLLMIKHGRIRK